VRDNHTQGAYSKKQAKFIEMPRFERRRDEFLDDAGYLSLQLELLGNPEAGDLIEGAGGVRKMRFPDARRGKGKRGGLRVIYYWWDGAAEFWMFDVYDKDAQRDLSPVERAQFRGILKHELMKRRH